MVIEVNRSGFHRVFRDSRLNGVSSRKSSKSSRSLNNKDSQDFLRRSLLRTKKILRKIILNQDFSRTSFLTLTFAENVQDLGQARYEFQKFMKRLNYYVHKTKQSKIKYIAVPERQERGAWHFHILLLDVPYIPNSDIADIWKNGFVKINQVRFSNMKQVYEYLVKYISKQFQENQKHFHRFFSSHGLFRGYEIRVHSTDIQEYENEVRYWMQNLYSQDDYRYVSGVEFQYEVGQQSFFCLIEFYFSKHFYDEVEKMHRSMIENHFEIFRHT